MELQNFTIKLYADGGQLPALERFVPVFHKWIAERSVDELLIDVADYAHVPAGPGILLVAHEAHYGIEYGPEERFGLIYKTREKSQGSNAERIRHALAQAFKSARLLETDPALRGDWSFRADRIRITVNRHDSVADPSVIFAALETDLRSVFDEVYGVSNYALDLDRSHDRRRLTVDVKSHRTTQLNEVLERNHPAPGELNLQGMLDDC